MSVTYGCPILVSSGSCNRMLWSGRLINNRNICVPILEREKSGIKVITDSASSRHHHKLEGRNPPPPATSFMQLLIPGIKMPWLESNSFPVPTSHWIPSMEIRFPHINSGKTQACPIPVLTSTELCDAETHKLTVNGGRKKRQYTLTRDSPIWA